MSDKVICPWCGWEMELHCHRIKNSDDFMANYYCATCDTESPGLVGKDEKALIQAVTQRAIRRCQPENRVLTPEEIQGIPLAIGGYGVALWTEIRYAPGGHYDDLDIIKYILSRRGPKQNERFWMCKPTDKERAAVPWEEE